MEGSQTGFFESSDSDIKELVAKAVPESAKKVFKQYVGKCEPKTPSFGVFDLRYTVAASTVMSSISYLINFKGSVKYLK